MRSGSDPMVLPLLALVLLGLLSGRAVAETTESLESRVIDQQQKIHRLSRGIEDQKSMLFASRQREFELLSTLEAVEGQLLADRKRLAALQEKLNEQEDRLDFKQVELDDLLVDQEEIASQVQARLAASYRMGGVGVLNAIFSTSSLPELLDIEEYLTRLVDHDRQTMATFRAKIDEVNQARAAIAAEKEQLAALYATFKEQERKTAATQEKHLALLRQVRTEKKLHQRAVNEMEQAALQVTATLEKLRTEALGGPQGKETSPPDAGPSPAADDRGFAARKGHLPRPVAGTVVTTFGEEVAGQFGLAARTHGIDIQTAPGAAIKAVHEGKVVYSGFLRGYGNLLIVDHGQQYYSLMSRAARFSKDKNDTVRAGEVVGIMGEASQLPPEGLHVEIRHGSEPEDPLSWFDPEAFSPTAEKPASDQPDSTSS